MKQGKLAGKTFTFSKAMTALYVALLVVFSLNMPTVAQALELTKSVDGTMTIQVQQAENPDINTEPDTDKDAGTDDDNKDSDNTQDNTKDDTSDDTKDNAKDDATDDSQKDNDDAADDDTQDNNKSEDADDTDGDETTTDDETDSSKTSGHVSKKNYKSDSSNTTDGDTSSHSSKTKGASDSKTKSSKKSSALAETGSSALLAFAVALAVMLLASCMILACESRKQQAGGAGESASNKPAVKVGLLCLIATILLAAAGAGMFLTSQTANATGSLDNIAINSEIKVDTNKNVLSNKITITNNTSKSFTIKEISAPSEVSAEAASLVGKTVAAGGELSASWDNIEVAGTTINNIVTKGGSADYSMTADVTFDFDMDVDTASQTYTGSDLTTQIITDNALPSEYFEVTYGKNKETGQASVTITGINGFTGSQTYYFTIEPKVLNISATVSSKTYDGTTKAEIDASTATLEGVEDGDDVKIASISGEFVDKKAGDDKDVSVTATLTGEDAANYTIAEDAKLTGSIAKKPVTITGVTVKDRAYEPGNYNAVLEGTPKFADGDIVEGDKVYFIDGIPPTGTYASYKAADDIDVTINYRFFGIDDANENYVVKDECKHTKANILAVIHINSNCDVPVADKYVHRNAKLTDDFSSTMPTRKGLKIEGWYRDAKCSDSSEKKWNFDTSVVDDSIIILNANWTTDDSATDKVYYWISPSSTRTTSNVNANAVNTDYVHENWHIERSSFEIQEDIATMKAEAANGTASNSDSVTSKYKEYMNEDEYHLYTRYIGGENEPGQKDDFTSVGSADGETSEMNAYAEFRIIEVGQHLNVEGDSSSTDGSFLTFMGTHTLPTADQLNYSTKFTDGGWVKTTLRTKLQSGGEIFKKFETGFTKDITPTTKYYNKGGGKSDYSVKYTACGTCSDQFWIPSFVELFGTSNCTDKEASPTEGTQYAWFNGKVGNVSGPNQSVYFQTRAGKYPGYAYYRSWRTRSPYTKGVKINGEEIGAFIWFNVALYGIPSDSAAQFSDQPDGIVLCFGF